MSLINKVAAIIDNHGDIDEVSYLKNKVNYNDEISILDINLAKIINTAPKNSSSTTAKEIEKISKATKNRSLAELELVHVVDREPLDLFYKFLKDKDLKFPQGLFDEHYNVLEQYIYALKYFHNRARPEQIAPYYGLEIEVLYTETHHTPSYPSGHTMYSELAAHILSDKYPEYRKDFFRLSEYCGFARILQGVHYPSDNKASKIATEKLYRLMKEKEDERHKEFPIDIQSKI